jgi:hypothetical protein
MRTSKHVSNIAIAAMGCVMFLAISQSAFAGGVAYGACMASPVTEDNRGFFSAAFPVYNPTNTTAYNLGNHFRFYTDSLVTYNNGNNATCGLFGSQQEAQTWLDRSRQNVRANGGQVIDTQWSG